jgi:hypothetical protein
MSQVQVIDSFAPAHSPCRASRRCRGLPPRFIHRIARLFSHFTWAIEVNRVYVASILAVNLFCIISCATSSHHEFSEPNTGWHTKSGQLMFRSAGTTLIGEALVRFSKSGDFELTVSKGPGITLLSLQQDANFAEVKGGLARQGWSGPVANAPPQLRGWLALRDQFLRAPDRNTLRYATGNETFVFRF